MPRLQHVSIRASAGTGKTHQLVHRYLALLLVQALRGRPAPDQIVALTFTRQGAGEFARRILHSLAAAADDPVKRSGLRTDLELLVRGDAALGIPGLATDLPFALPDAQVPVALAATVDAMDRLVLGTIDSFMARSVQTLAFELGLGGFEILDEPALQRERERLLSAVFDAVQTQEFDEFYQTLKRATLRSAGSLRRELDHCVAGCHELLQTLPRPEAWGGSAFWGAAVPQPPGTDWKAQARELAEDLAGEDFGHATIRKSLGDALEWLATRTPGLAAGGVPSWLDTDGKLVQLWQAQPTGDWGFDYARRRRTLPQRFVRPLLAILEAWRAAEAVALSEKTAALHAIAENYEQLYDRLARRQGRLSFADLPLLLRQLPGQPPAAVLQLLAFRWYQQFHHWLLDEFQDTSRHQWEVLRPWLDEAVQDDAGTKSVFVVGDPKQSIYGWRGGEPRLFDELPARWPGAFQRQAMDCSWRSRPAVLELVNRVCAPAANPALTDPKRFAAAALPRWDFHPHHAAPNRADAPGYAAVLLAPAAEQEADDPAGVADEADGNGPALRLAARARVLKAIIEQVRPLERGLSCGILVRKNESAQGIAQWLRTHDVPHVMVEGVATLAAQSPLVAALVDALRWLATPADSFAAGHVHLTPLADVLRRPLSGRGATSSGAVWRYWRERVAAVGAAQVTQQWCDELAVTQTDPYARYCLRQVSQWAQQAGNTWALADWRATLEQLAVRETAAPGAIHVMTIHKAKGLGFDVVLLPDLDAGTRGQDEMLIRRDAQGQPVGCLAYPPKWLQCWQPALRDLCEAQRAERDLEALCVLYVALTRAREATFVVLSETRPRQDAPLRDWLLMGVGTGGRADTGLPESPWAPGRLVWERGRRDFAPAAAPALAAAACPQPPSQLPALHPRLRRRRPSEAATEPGTRDAAAEAEGGAEFGTAVHRVFEQIEWWTPELALTGPTEAVDLVRACLTVPEILELFQRRTARDEAWRELPIEYREGDVWWSGVMDRLVVRRDDAGRLCRALVVDFKTDRVETMTGLRERYGEQLAVYRRAVSAALGLDAEQVSAVLLSTHLRTVALC